MLNLWATLDNVVRMVKVATVYPNRCFDARLLRCMVGHYVNNIAGRAHWCSPMKRKGQERKLFLSVAIVRLWVIDVVRTFPKERDQADRYVLIADAGGPLGKKELIPISAYLPPPLTTSKARVLSKTWLKQGRLTLHYLLAKEVQLKDKGFTDDQISIRLVNRPSESTFDVLIIA